VEQSNEVLDDNESKTEVPNATGEVVTPVISSPRTYRLGH